MPVADTCPYGTPRACSCIQGAVSKVFETEQKPVQEHACSVRCKAIPSMLWDAHVIGSIIEAETAIVRRRRSTRMPPFPESHQNLLNAEVALLATLGPNDYPQVMALWFLCDDAC